MAIKKSKFSKSDRVILLGLVIVAAGIAMLSVAVALIFTGVCTVGLGCLYDLAAAEPKQEKAEN